MFKKYILPAWRNLRRSKVFSTINIVGLAIGMAATILIALWIQNELAFDRSYKKTDRLSQVFTRQITKEESSAWERTPDPLGPVLKAEYPDIENAVRISESDALLSVSEKHIKSTGVFADTGFVSMFDFPVLNGSITQAFNHIQNIIITESLSKKLFGKENAVGKNIRLDTTDNFTVTAVLKDLPGNTRFNFEYILPFAYAEKIYGKNESWTAYNDRTYVLLKKEANINAVNEKIKDVAARHFKSKDKNESLSYFLYPATRWHLYDKSDNGQMVGGQVERVKLFALIACVILLIACINFTNLSTARSEKRAKEVGIRKAVGARKGSLVIQFIAESMLLALFAGLIAIVLSYLSLPFYNETLQTDFHLPLNSLEFWLYWLAFIVLTGLLAGCYPAFFLSSFNPTTVLKGLHKHTGNVITPRKVLVVVQFTFAITLIISTLIIRKQIEYAEDRDAGFDKGQLAFSPLEGNNKKSYSLIKQDLLNSGAVVSVTKSLVPISADWTSDMWAYQWPGSSETDSRRSFDVFSSDADFAKTLGTSIVSGRDIDIYQYPTDSSAILLSEKAADIMNLSDPIGQTIKRGKNEVYHVVGIIKNFVIGSPYNNIRPMIVMGPKYGWYRTIHYKLNDKHPVNKNLAQVQTIFKKYNPDYPFEYRFVDEAYAEKFKNEQTIKKIANIFAALAIFISCLGLFGLATYMAESRVKEIGIRKVLGASKFKITALLSADSVKLIIISISIASPIAWWAMNKWLQNYEYRTSINGWIFLIAGIVAIAIAILTVGYQSIKAASANPVKSLRSE